jgi:hypothetical protein
MKTTCTVAALPLILSLAIIPAAQARPSHADWRDAYGSVAVRPHRDFAAHAQMRGTERWFAPPAPEIQPQDHVKDPFASLHFE